MLVEKLFERHGFISEDRWYRFTGAEWRRIDSVTLTEAESRPVSFGKYTLGYQAVGSTRRKPPHLVSPAEKEAGERR